jgi:poly [ADP-ribose] polymerase
MFLNEVAIGKQHVIQRDDGSLTQAPKGSDSVLAKGTQEPGKMHLSCY